MLKVIRTVPGSIWACKLAIFALLRCRGTSKIYLHARKRRTGPQNREAAWTQPSTLPSAPPSRRTPRRMRFLGGCGGRGLRGDEASAHRSFVTLPIMQLPRQKRRGPGRGGCRRTSYRHESRPLTEVSWSRRSPEVAQSGFVEAVLTRVLLPRLPASVRMRPSPCFVSSTAHGKADSPDISTNQFLLGPDLPRRR
ncbi:hypothetical protein B0H63DRAFT_190866 [Podospora didyma]|uniref:Uncharacterized protein n=1 Tax=Podospora didyma TaxID=330526 RepID=A0AAE0NQY1_9PEZI|nr:hypothetical protein B0H63DRAFT_190866 [Podospora didyma]